MKIKTKEKIIKLYQSGLSSRKVSKIVGVGKSTVASLIKSKCLSRSNLEWTKNKKKMAEIYLKLSQDRKGKALPLHRKYKINLNLFKNLSNPFEAYLFGIIATDGHVAARTISLMVSNVDKEWMDALAKKIKVKLKIDNRGYPYLNINSVDVVKTIKNLGINSQKTRFPQKITIPKAWKDFTRGLIDGDGSVYFNKKNIGVCFGNTNKFLVNFVCEKMRKFGTKCNVLLVNSFKSQKTAKRPYILPFYNVSCSGRAATGFLKEIYYKKCFAINRKMQKVKQIQ
jgi:hypothetical protein